ncbi:MAG: hypothetical protein K0Q59_4742, partial [Paenibacillus sp.]|nr:hypothetical protein [Paenibacillus sp.]
MCRKCKKPALHFKRGDADFFVFTGKNLGAPPVSRYRLRALRVAVQLLVVAFKPQQLLMIALLHNLALTHDDDPIRLHNRRQAMRDYERCAAFRDDLQSRLHELLS